MRLQNLRVRNWRSFPACDINLDNDVTVIIGQNGAGKTALLNAFVWGLYGEVAASFPRPKDLCNHQAKLALGGGETTEVEVAVTFIHRECRYEARRSLSIRRTNSDGGDFEEVGPKFVLNIYPKDGYARTLSDQDADREVRAILPLGLNPYFFFPAENIGTSAAPDADAASVKEAVEILLGLKRYEVALTTIKQALAHRKLKGKTPNDITLAKAKQAAMDARDKHDKASARIKQLPGAIRDVKRALDAAEAQFKRVDGARELIEQRNDIQRRHDEAERKANEAVTHRREILDEECFNLFGREVLTAARAVLDKAKADHKIPPRVSTGLLDELIDSADSCICGTQISEDERRSLRDLREIVVDDNLAETASNIRSRVTERHDRLESRPAGEQPHQRLHGAQMAIHDAHAEKKTLRDELERFIEQNPMPEGTFSDASASWLRFQQKYADLKEEKKTLDARCEELLQERRAADTKYGQLSRQKDSSDKLTRAHGHLQNVENVIEDLHALFNSRAREDAQRLMNTIARDIFFRDYTIRLTDGFELEVRQDGLDIGASSGERAWVTLAFVGAMAHLIDQYGRDLTDMDEAGNAELKPGYGYPLVLDAPFSPFGEKYAGQFAARLPDLVPQSVVIIREDQIRHLGPIMTSEASVAAYLMCLYVPHTHNEQTITWGNDGWGDMSVRPYVQPAANPSQVRTEIVELPT